MKKDKPSKKEQELAQQLGELTADLQRQRADFENYRKRVDQEKQQLQQSAAAATILKLLPVIDTIDRAVAQAPAELAGEAWVKGVVALGKSLDKTLEGFGLERITATPGTPFDPNRHEAVSMDDTPGTQEVVAEELRPGYVLNGMVIRPSMVKVTRTNDVPPQI